MRKEWHEVSLQKCPEVTLHRSCMGRSWKEFLAQAQRQGISGDYQGLPWSDDISRSFLPPWGGWTEGSMRGSEEFTMYHLARRWWRSFWTGCGCKGNGEKWRKLRDILGLELTELVDGLNLRNRRNETLATAPGSLSGIVEWLAVCLLH